MASWLPSLAPPFPWAGEASAALSALLWGSSGIVFARIRPPLSASALNLGKNAVAMVCFAGLVWSVRGTPWPAGLDGRSVAVFAASGFLGLTLCDTFLLRSLLAIGPQRMSLVFLLVPVLTALVTALPPFAERAPWHVWAGMLVCLAGLSLAVRRRHVHPVAATAFRRGVRDAVIAAVLQTAAVVLARYGLSVEQAPVADSALVRMTAGTLGLVVVGAFTGRLGRWRRSLCVPRTAAVLAGASFFGTFLGILTNQIGLQWAQHTGVATTLNSLMPIYLVPLSALFLHERFDARSLVATAVAVGGVALMLLGG